MARAFTALWTASVVAFACSVGADENQPASAAPGKPVPESLFKQLDKNADGQLTPDEVSDEHRRLFERMLRRHDADGNGKLSLDEFTKGLSEAPPEVPAGGPRSPGEGNERLRSFLDAEPAELFKKMDANGDGKLVVDELPHDGRQQLAQFFERADIDLDKALTADEFRKGHEQLRQYLGGGAPRPGQTGQTGPEQQGGMGPGQVVFRALDLDGDGTLSADEIGKATESLKKLDQDGDGVLQPRELFRPGRAGQPGRPGQPGGSPNAAPGRFVERLKQLDKDGDGKLSKDEAPPFLRQRFDQVDANHDGYLDADELRGAVQGLQQRQPGGQNPRKRPNEP